MVLQVTHATVASGTDSGNGEIHKAEWNASHSISMATNKLLGRSTAGTGTAEEITIGSQLSLAAGTLNVGTGIPVASSTMATNKLLGRTTASSGAVEELSAGSSLSLSAGTLDVSSSVIQNLDLVKVSRSGGSIIDITDYNNVSVSGLSTYTWAQFTDVGFDLTKARHVVVSDKHSSISLAGGSLWYIDPTAAVGSKRICRSGAIVTTWATRPAASSFFGLEIYVSDLPTLPRYRSDGTNYLPVGRQLLFSGIFGTFASPTESINLTNSAQTFAWATQPKILGGMGITGSRFFTEAHLYRNSNTSGYTPTISMFLGRNGTAADLAMYGTAVSNAATSSAYIKNQVTLRSQQSIVSSYNGSWGGASFVNTTAVERNSAPTQLDFAYDQFLSFQVAATATTPSPAETLSIQTLQLWHEI